MDKTVDTNMENETTSNSQKEDKTEVPTDVSNVSDKETPKIEKKDESDEVKNNGKTKRKVYDDVMDALKSDQEGGSLENDEEEIDETMWNFDSISGHRLSKKRKIEVLVHWTSGEETWEPLSTVRQDDPVTLAQYAIKNNLQDTTGWKWSSKYADVLPEDAAATP